MIEDRLMSLAAKAPLTRGLHDDRFYLPFGQRLGAVFQPEKAIMPFDDIDWIAFKPKRPAPTINALERLL
jgi:hypothetical protein